MKEIMIETKLVAASPESGNTNFVQKVMEGVRSRALATRLPAQQRRGFIHWVCHLHKPALIALAVATVALVSGAVYASVQFAPGLIKLLGKDTSQGHTQYSVAGFADCSKNNGNMQKFELNNKAPALSDAEVQKIIQAKCELQWITSFANHTWPTYGQNAQWEDGDHIYYARPDFLGTLVSADAGKAIMTYNPGDGNKTQNYTVAQNERVRAFSEGQEIPLTQLKPGDTIFSIVRVQETYTRLDRNKPQTSPQPTPVGLLALIKLSLPKEYYGQMQQYITEVPSCPGNPHDYCSSTPSIDVFPRGGEGATNQAFNSKTNTIYRQITGKVTALAPNKVTLQSSSGTTFTVTLNTDGFADYNTNYAPIYNAEGTDGELKIGSSIDIRYAQAANGDPTKISADQVITIDLKLESLNPKHDKKIGQY